MFCNFGTGDFSRSIGILSEIYPGPERHAGIPCEYHYVDRSVVLGIPDQSMVYEVFQSCFMDDFYGNLAFVYDRVPFVFLKAGFNRSTDHYDEHSRSWAKCTVSGYLCYDF